jgi:hypothetical protein
MPRRHPEFFQDENIIFRKTFYSDSSKTTPVDPSTVTFKIKSPSGTISTPSVTDEPGTGIYTASKVVNEYGLWQWRWITTGPVVVDQGTINVVQKNIE